MTTVGVATPRTSPDLSAALSRFWKRELTGYPDNRYRTFLLAIAVLSNIVLVWTVSAGSAAATVALTHYHMTLTYFSYLLVVSGAIGACASYLSSFADRWGRANLVVAGLAINALFALVALPEAPTRTWYAVFTCVLALADGAIFVGTPALVRDFSPQMQRGLAMGFWTFGPVAGSLIISAMGHLIVPTPATFASWQTLYRIAGLAAVVMFLVALFYLRELSPQLRSQRMAVIQERALVEIRARGLDVEAAMQHRWRQVLKPDLILSPIVINLFLLIYFTATSYLIFYFTSVLHYSVSAFDGLQTIYWGVNVVALVVFGLLSDLLKVRKPFMLLGALVTIAMILVIMHEGPATSHGTFAWQLSVLAAFLGCCYAPWFASFTETIEAHNPALVATGTAMYGFATRAILAPFGLIFPAVVSAYNGIVNNAAYASYAPQVKALLASHQPLTASQAALVRNVGPHLKALGAAVAAEPAQWNHWFYACVGGVVLFVPMISLLAGRWLPSRAAADLAEHEARVQRELEALGQAGLATA